MSAAKKTPTKKKSSLPAVGGDLARLQILLAKKQEYVAILELEITNTRADLNTFTQLYNEHIGPLQRQANTLRKILYEALEKQREAEKESSPDNPAYGKAPNMDEAEFPEDQPHSDQQQDRRKNQNDSRANGKEERHDPKLEEQIRDLFRKLAKRFHPDLTADPEEKKQREVIMAQVNEAYTARDLQALLDLAETPDIAKARGSRSNAKRIAQLRTELKRLDIVIKQLELTIRQIDSSPIMHLRMETKLARRDGKELLSDMAADLQIQINDLEEHLDVLGIDFSAQAEQA